MMVAAYLINPLVGEYPYDAVAKDLISAGYAKEIKPAKPKAGGKAIADA